MTNYTLESFVQECRDGIVAGDCPADCVENTAPAMYQLLNGDRSFLQPQHKCSDPEHYSRNLIFMDENDTMSLYALVWLPGQWTPIHDHGTWGVVGVLEGTLEEHNYININTRCEESNTDIDLVRGGVIMLAPGAVTSFVPNPDHIHITGNSDPSQPVVSLHLYGHGMAGFHTYDIEARNRHWIEVSHNES